MEKATRIAIRDADRLRLRKLKETEEGRPIYVLLTRAIDAYCRERGLDPLTVEPRRNGRRKP